MLLGGTSIRDHLSDLPVFMRGLLLGFAIAAPVGPIGVLCIRRTLAEGRLIGFLSGLGAATADMLYGTVAAFGLTAVQGLLVRQQFWLQNVGGLFLLYLGLRTFFTPPAEPSARATAPRGKLPAYLTTLGLTLANPATILSFTIIFAGFRLTEASGSFLAPALLVFGVFLGSAAWWLLLSSAVAVFRNRFDSRWMLWVNRVAGMLIAGFGAVAFLAL
jgi:threonine/homoserine/homoserine lactone efflux protein